MEQEPLQLQPDGSSFPQVAYCGRYTSYQCLPITFIELLMLSQTCNKVGIALSQTCIKLSSKNLFWYRIGKLKNILFKFNKAVMYIQWALHTLRGEKLYELIVKKCTKQLTNIHAHVCTGTCACVPLCICMCVHMYTFTHACQICSLFWL